MATPPWFTKNSLPDPANARRTRPAPGDDLTAAPSSKENLWETRVRRRISIGFAVVLALGVVAALVLGNRGGTDGTQPTT